MTQHEAIQHLREHFRYINQKWTNNRLYVERICEAWAEIEAALEPAEAMREAEINAMATSLDKLRKLLQVYGLTVKGVSHAESYPVEYIEVFAEWCRKNPRLMSTNTAAKTELFKSHFRQMAAIIESEIETVNQYRVMKEKKQDEIMTFLRSYYPGLRQWFDAVDDGEQIENKEIENERYNRLIEA